MGLVIRLLRRLVLGVVLGGAILGRTIGRVVVGGLFIVGLLIGGFRLRRFWGMGRFGSVEGVALEGIRLIGVQGQVGHLVVIRVCHGSLWGSGCFRPQRLPLGGWLGLRFRLLFRGGLALQRVVVKVCHGDSPFQKAVMSVFQKYAIGIGADAAV